MGSVQQHPQHGGEDAQLCLAPGAAPALPRWDQREPGTSERVWAEVPNLIKCDLIVCKIPPHGQGLPAKSREGTGWTGLGATWDSERCPYPWQRAKLDGLQGPLKNQSNPNQSGIRI